MNAHKYMNSFTLLLLSLILKMQQLIIYTQMINEV